MRRIVVFLSFICFFIATSQTFPEQNAPSNSAGGEIVALSGESFAPLFGSAPDKLALFAMTADGFAPVPFQIDQRYKKGDKVFYVYTGGKKKTKNPNPNFDALDELVFWSGDAGAKVEMDKWPSNARGLEIAVETSGGVGYVYLLAFPDKAPRSTTRYVSYDPKTDRIEALYYDLAYPKKHKVGFVDFAIKAIAGGSGEDFVDEAKYHGSARLAGTILPYELDRNQVHTKVISWIDGPVRARRYVRNYIELWIWLGSTSHAENVYTPAGFSVEVPVVGFIPIKGLANASTRWSLELNDRAIGMTFRSDNNPAGVAIDGAMDESERNMNYSPPQWLLLTGKPGAIIRRPGKVSDRTLYMDMYYMDNKSFDEPPEETPGQIGASGYYMPFAGRMGMKVRENIVEYYDVLPNYQSGDERAFLERASKPIKITVSATQMEAQRPGPTEYPPPSKPRPDAAEPSYKYVGAEAPEIESQVLPIFVLSSDNGFGGGLMYVNANMFDSRIRFQTQAWYTVKSYTFAEIKLGEEIPKKGSDWAWIVYGKYHLRPGRDFYGLGNDSARDDQTNFYDEVFLLQLWGKRRIWKSFWLGANLIANHEYIGNGEGDWSPNSFDPKYFPDLYCKGTYWTNKVGGFLLMDTRDSYYIPTKGGYRQIEYYSVPKWMGNDFAFEYWYLDFRQFVPIRQPRKDILALRFQAKHGSGGPIPFYELAIDGSEYTLRGYFDGRFRDRDIISMNTEWRHNLWKIVDVHFFYDAGRTYNDMFEESKGLLTSLHPAWGTGFRITIPPNIVMRGDAGWSKTDNTFYFNWGQTF